jgi:hypothetical protein
MAERMPYLLSTYRSEDRVIIQCENVERAEEALCRVMEWLHSQVETLDNAHHCDCAHCERRLQQIRALSDKNTALLTEIEELKRR